MYVRRLRLLSNERLHADGAATTMELLATVTHVRHLSMKSTNVASVDLRAVGRGRLPGRLRRPLVLVMVRGFPRESADTATRKW